MKTIVFVLVLLLSVASLTLATPQQEATDKPITLTFYHYASQTHLLYINPLKEGFEKAYPSVSSYYPDHQNPLLSTSWATQTFL